MEDIISFLMDLSYYQFDFAIFSYWFVRLSPGQMPIADKSSAEVDDDFIKVAARDTKRPSYTIYSCICCEKELTL